MPERSLTAAVQAALGANPIRPVLLFEGEYVSGGAPAYLRLVTGVGELTWDGKTWIGGADMLSITPIRETAQLEAVGFAVRLSGLSTDKLSIALQSMRKNRPGKLWLGFFDAAGALIADPYMVRRGRFDTVVIERTGDTMTVEARYEDVLVDLERPRERRYTHEDQQLRLAGDKGFDQVPELQDAQDVWGGAVTAPIANPPRMRHRI